MTNMKRLIMLLVSGIFVAGCSILPEKNVDSITSNINQNTGPSIEEGSDEIGNFLQQESDVIIAKNGFENEITLLLDQAYQYPIENYQQNTTVKQFGQFIPADAEDKFQGYHTGDDIEVSDVNMDVPVFALTSAVLVKKQYVTGYGGVAILEFEDDDKGMLHALYGHLDINSVKHQIGDFLDKGEQIGLLGDHESAETDGERKHLHFGIYPYNNTELYSGYVDNEADLSAWIDPSQFLREHYVESQSETDIKENISNTLKDAANNIGNTKE